MYEIIVLKYSTYALKKVILKNGMSSDVEKIVVFGKNKNVSVQLSMLKAQKH